MRLTELAAKLHVEVEGDGDLEVTGLAPIDEAGPTDVTFLANPKYRPMLATSKAGAVIVSRDEVVGGRTVLRADVPYLSFVDAAEIFDSRPKPRPGIHPSCVIDPTAEIGEGAYLGACAVVGAHVRIGIDACIHPNVTIYDGATIGDRFTAHASSVVRESVVLGDDVVLQAGAVIGGDGFGYIPLGEKPPRPIPQIGTVHLADKVEIGSNATVDRAAVGVTVVGEGCKLDNLVMLAHGAKLGAGSLLAAQSGIAGSTRVGKRLMTGGQTGLNGHLEVGDDVKIAAGSKVLQSVESGKAVAGYPATDMGVWRRYAVQLSRLPELFRRVARLEKELEEGKG